MEEEKEKKKQEKQQKEAKKQAKIQSEEQAWEQAKKERENSSINRAITTAIQDIEKVMSEKEIKIEELGEYSNYKEQINSLTRVWKIHSLREEIIDSICELAKKNNQNISEFTSKNKQEAKGEEGQISGKSDDNQKPNYNKLTREELIKTINQKDLENNSLKEIIQALERKIEELEEEIRELKAEPQTSQIQQEIKKRENYLQEARSSLEKINALNNGNPTSDTGNNKSNNNFLTSLVIGGGILAVVGLTVAALAIKKNKKRRT